MGSVLEVTIIQKMYRGGKNNCYFCGIGVILHCLTGGSTNRKLMQGCRAMRGAVSLLLKLNGGLMQGCFLRKIHGLTRVKKVEIFPTLTFCVLRKV